MIDYGRIRKECFWDLNLTEMDIEKILEGTDCKHRKLLFDKILLNSIMLLLDLRIFPREELSQLL